MSANVAKARIKNIDLEATDFGKFIVGFSRHTGRNKKGDSKNFVYNCYKFQKLSLTRVMRVLQAQQALVNRYDPSQE